MPPHQGQVINDTGSDQGQISHREGTAISQIYLSVAGRGNFGPLSGAVLTDTDGSEGRMAATAIALWGSLGSGLANE